MNGNEILLVVLIFFLVQAVIAVEYLKKMLKAVFTLLSTN